MKKLIVMLSLIVSGLQATAQTKDFSVYGTVVSQEDDEALSGATVELTLTLGTAQVGVVTDIDGNFRLGKVAPGEYTLVINYLGLKTHSQTIKVQDSDVNVGKIALSEEAQMINEVKVKARVPLGRQRGDTTQFNAKAFKTAPDASAEDLVSKMPGITVEGGIVQAQGEDVKQVLIDGKHFGGSDVGAALRSIPSDMIESVEIFDRQSDQAIFSGFDDGNSEKTLNLVTRKDRRKGESCKISAGYGTEDRYIVGAAFNIFDHDRKISFMGLTNNINMLDFSIGETPGGGMRGRRVTFGGRTPSGIISTNAIAMNYNDLWGKKMEITSSYNFTARDLSNNETTIRNFTAGEQEGSQLEQAIINNTKEDSHRFDLRMQYNINENNRLLITPKITFQQNNANTDGLTQLYDEEGVLFTNSETENRTDYSTLNLSNNILYSHRFLKPGRVFTTNFNTTFSNIEQNNFFIENSVNNEDPDQNAYRNQYNNIDRESFSWSGSASISERVGKNALVQLEYTIGNQNNESDKRTYDLDPEDDTREQLNVPLSSSLIKDYLSQSIGPSYRYRTDKINLQFTAQYQYATLESNTIYPETLNIDRSFSNLLPSAELEYKLSETQNLNVNFRTSTNPPSTEQLQQVLDISNPLQLGIGNSSLDQDYQNSLFIHYRSFDPETNKVFFLGVFGTATQNYIGNSVYENPPAELLNGYDIQPGARLFRHENMNGFWNVRTFFNYGKPVDFISSTINLRGGVGYTRTPGKINDASNFANNTHFGIGLHLSSNISENIDFNISTNGHFNIVNNTNTASGSSNHYFTQSSDMRLNWILGKGLVYRTELKHQYSTGVTEAADNHYTVWNMSFGKKFLKDNRAEISLSVNDILNENRSLQQNVTESYVEDVKSSVLQRFFMLTLTFNLRSYSGEEAPPKKEHKINFRPG